MKVFILHPSFDYCVEGVFLTRKGAEDRLQQLNAEADSEWELHKKSDCYRPDPDEEEHNFFRRDFYIHEVEVME